MEPDRDFIISSRFEGNKNRLKRHSVISEYEQFAKRILSLVGDDSDNRR